MAADVGGRGAIAGRVWLGGKGIVGVGSESVAACDRLGLEAVVEASARPGCYRGLPLLGGLGGGEGVDELDMQRLNGSQRPGVGLPVQVVEGESREQPGGKELVDIVRVEVIDWAARVSIAIRLASAPTTATTVLTGEDSSAGVGVYLSPWRSRRAVPC